MRNCIFTCGQESYNTLSIMSCTNQGARTSIADIRYRNTKHNPVVTRTGRRRLMPNIFFILICLVSCHHCHQCWLFHSLYHRSGIVFRVFAFTSTLLGCQSVTGDFNLCMWSGVLEPAVETIQRKTQRYSSPLTKVRGPALPQ